MPCVMENAGRALGMIHNFSPQLSRNAAIWLLARSFAQAGIETPQLDARLLVCAATGIDHAELIRNPDAPIGSAGEALARQAQRRIAGEPISRILQKREFWGLTLAITPNVLDPRADTEALVQAALDRMARRKSERLRILDLGTGSGALLCALLDQWPHATGIGIDRSEAACHVAWRNLARHGLHRRALVACADWGSALAGGFDVIVSNPPYIETGAIRHLARDVREHDPAAALDGGPDGLSCYRQILAQLPQLLEPGGVAIIELGAAQADAVAVLALAAALRIVDLRTDFGGIARAMVLELAA